MNCRYPDTIAVCYSSVENKLICIYNDHSLYIWDLSDIRKVGKARSFLFHSGAVWGIDVSYTLLAVVTSCHLSYAVLYFLLLANLHESVVMGFLLLNGFSLNMWTGLTSVSAFGWSLVPR